MNITNLESFHNTGISFHGSTVKASFNELNKVIADPPCNRSNNGQEKTNFEWNCKPDDGDIFTIYDWKEYRTISTDEQIEWHIDGFCKGKTEIEADTVKLLLKKSR